MKHREQLIAKTAECKPSHYRAVQASLAAAGLLLLGCTVSEQPPSHSMTNAPAESPAPTQTPMPGLDTLRTLVIDQTNGGNKYKFSVIHIEQELREAGKRLDEMTDGTVTLPKDPIIEIVDLTPLGTYTATSEGGQQLCYTDGQLETARQQFLARQGASENDRVAIVINQGRTCHSVEASATAWAIAETNSTVFDGNFDHRVFFHEEGHLEGMGHAASLTCNALEGTGRSMAETSQIDIAVLMSHGCNIHHYNSKGKKDLYSDTQTVMGGIPPKSEHEHDDLYNYFELNKLAPSVVKGETVLPVDGTYRLGVGDGDMRFVSLDLSPGHPLQTVDNNMNKLSIGLNRKESVGGGMLTEVRLIASAENNQTYSLDFAMPYTLPIDEDKKDTIMYVDKTLGIEIIVNSSRRAESVAVTIKRLAE